MQHHKTIVISDIHLGSKWSKTREVTNFLKKNSCETLILCGDIIDGWAILRNKKAKWQRIHTNFIKAILDISHVAKVIYIKGNHDDFLERIAPLEFLNISITKEYILKSKEKNFLVLHGDILDNVTSYMGWLAKIGDLGYSFLLWCNRIYNKRRAKKGLPYYSFAKEVKHRTKTWVSFISNFDKKIIDLAHSHNCQGVICGHIHHPEIRTIEDILYLNSGDWVESLSALTEDFDGNWEIQTHAIGDI